MNPTEAWRAFRAEPIAAIAGWQDTRAPWLLLAVVSLLMLVLAHGVFQIWLYMQPCEHCVYIRVAFFCLVVAGGGAALSPGNVICKGTGYLLAFYGTTRGIVDGLKLNAIHQALRGDDPFGVQGCSLEPAFPLGLPLDSWSPAWFKPTGDCGVDSPIVPDDATLGEIQRWLIGFYADGWYLWPDAHFMNMAQACLTIFSVMLLALAAAFLSWLIMLGKRN